MTVIRSIPKRSTFREVHARYIYDYQFLGAYAGQYVCVAPNNLQSLMSFNSNTVYLIDNISVASSLPENYFIESLQAAQFPALKFRRVTANELLSPQPIEISQHYREKTISQYVDCNKERDGLNLEIIGRLNQIPYTIGLTEIYLSVSCGIYEIDLDTANKFYREED